jgi:predicted enzyme related to lactoylglutathione lyase
VTEVSEAMEVLSARTLLVASDLARSRRFYEGTLGLAVYREWSVGVVYFLGGGYLELSGAEPFVAPPHVVLWLQVRDVEAEARRLRARGVELAAPPAVMPWGLIECALAGPDGEELRLVEMPPDHPLRGRR